MYILLFIDFLYFYNKEISYNLLYKAIRQFFIYKINKRLYDQSNK